MGQRAIDRRSQFGWAGGLVIDLEGAFWALNENLTAPGWVGFRCARGSADPEPAVPDWRAAAVLVRARGLIRMSERPTQIDPIFSMGYKPRDASLLKAWQRGIHPKLRERMCYLEVLESVIMR
jgi:hypothetical protein